MLEGAYSSLRRRHEVRSAEDTRSSFHVVGEHTFVLLSLAALSRRIAMPKQGHTIEKQRFALRLYAAR